MLRLACGRYVPIFREQELHGEILAGISEDDLQSILGVRDPQDRELLMAAIRQACGLYPFK